MHSFYVGHPYMRSALAMFTSNTTGTGIGAGSSTGTGIGTGTGIIRYMTKSYFVSASLIYVLVLESPALSHLA